MSTTTETKQAWTPGPWIAELQRNKYHDDLGWIIQFKGGRIGWASLAYEKTNREADKTDPAREANAKLIAKAPEMAKVLLTLIAFERNEPDLLESLAESSASMEENPSTVVWRERLIEQAERVLREAGAL